MIFGILFSLTHVATYGLDKSDYQSIGVIAHRGFWTALKDSTQNSIASLEAALKAGFYGSETDVWMTKDSILVIHHDASINDIVIAENNYAEIKDLKLSNGESIPLMEDFLVLLKDKTNSPTKLIIEIKGLTGESVSEAAEKVVEMVSAYELQDRIEYISFWMDALLKVKEVIPDAICSYLSPLWPRERFTPQELASLGMNMDYELSLYNDNPSWIQDAHEYGLTTNVWTVNTYNQIYDIMLRGIDFVTTNNPDLATEIKNEIEKQSSLTDLKSEEKDVLKYYDLNGYEITNPIPGKPMIRVNLQGKAKLIRPTLTK